MVGCGKEIDFTIPEINTQPSNAGVLDTVTSIVYAEGTIDNTQIDVSYEWSIKNTEGAEVIPFYKSSDTIKWVPTKEGDYTIKATGSVGNKSVTKHSFLAFNNTIKTFQTASKN